MMITSAHLRTVPYFSARHGFCARGSRAWFKQHRLDFHTFMRGGLPEETLLATGDGMAKALVKWAHEQGAKGG